MTDKERVDKFYSDVARLGLKFPGARIAEATGYSKGTVSSYLNKDLEPSRAFLDSFYNKFQNSLPEIPPSNELTEPETNYEGKYDRIIRMLDKSLDANSVHAAANEKNADNLAKLLDLLTAKLSLARSGSASLSADDLNTNKKKGHSVQLSGRKKLHPEPGAEKKQKGIVESTGK